MSFTDEDYHGLVQTALATFTQHGDHIPMLLAFARDDTPHLVPLVWMMNDTVPRSLSYAVLRRVLKMVDADSYVLVIEAWMSSTTMPPSADPQRKEVLQVIGVFPDGRQVNTVIPIASGKVVGEPVYHDSSVEKPTGSEMGGELINLLNAPMSTPVIERLAAEIAGRLRDQIMKN